MSIFSVLAESPSALAEPYVVVELADAVVSWHPERGWMCQEHWQQPCSHTAGLLPAKNPEWNQ